MSQELSGKLQVTLRQNIDQVHCKGCPQEERWSGSQRSHCSINISCSGLFPVERLQKVQLFVAI